jgi:uncharacterized protein (TIGR03083 family)
MSSADTVIAALNAGYYELAGLVSGFSDDDLSHSSGAAEWDISQVLSHLGSGAEIARATLRAALDGEPNPGLDYNRSVWDKWDAMSRRERADGFLEANRDLLALYESLDEDTREKLRINLGFLPAPVDLATATRLRLSEFTLHSWDVRVGFDEHATLAPDATAVLLHGEPDLTGWLGKADALDGRELTVKVTTTEPASVFSLLLRAPVGVDHETPEHPDGTLSLPAEAWLRLVSGRLAPRYTPANIVADGDADLDLLRRVFAGF